MGNRSSCLSVTMALVAVALSSQPSGAQDTTEICLWQAKSGELIRVMPQEGTATSVAFSPDGATLASGSSPGGSEKGCLKFWDVKTGKLVRKADLDGAVNALQFFADGKTLAVGTLKATVLVSGRTGKPIAKLGDGYTKFLDVSRDGKTVVSNAGGKIAVWDVATGKVLARVKPKDYAYGVSISPDGKRFAFGSRAGDVGIAELATGRIVHTHQTPKLVQNVAFSPDGKQLAAGNIFKGEIYIWDTSTREKISEIKLGNHGIFSLAWSPQGTFLAASVYHDRLIALVDPKTGKHSLSISITDLLGARSVAVSPDGKMIAAACTPTVMR